MKHYKDKNGNFFGFDDDQTVPLGMTEVTVEEIELDNAQKAKSEFEIMPYAQKRLLSYPSIQDQLDMLYWDSVNGTDNWKTAIESVKEKYPKGI